MGSRFCCRSRLQCRLRRQSSSSPLSIGARVLRGPQRVFFFNLPGAPVAGATPFPGFPVGGAGRGGTALTAPFPFSFNGAFFSIGLVPLFSPLLGEIALKFGPPEFFAI